MRRIAALVLAAMAAVTASAAAAQTIVYEEVIEEEYLVEAGGERFVGAHEALQPQIALPRGIASYGPFRVLDESHAALVGVTDATAPFRFADMMRAHPGIATLEMIECPGTEDDIANLRLGRMIRDAGLATHVPADGSVRSGAVELFLAGTRRSVDKGAEFAVHAWMDDTGHEATDYAATAPENVKYLAYYRAMGMTAAEAREFYAMTNSVPNADAKWLSAGDMAKWVRLD